MRFAWRSGGRSWLKQKNSDVDVDVIAKVESGSALGNSGAGLLCDGIGARPELAGFCGHSILHGRPSRSHRPCRFQDSRDGCTGRKLVSKQDDRNCGSMGEVSSGEGMHPTYIRPKGIDCSILHTSHLRHGPLFAGNGMFSSALRSKIASAVSLELSANQSKTAVLQRF